MKPFMGYHVCHSGDILICIKIMREGFFYFISHWADKFIALSGIAIFKATSLFGMLFLADKKKNNAEKYKVVIEKEKF